MKGRGDKLFLFLNKSVHLNSFIPLKIKLKSKRTFFHSYKAAALRDLGLSVSNSPF